MTANNDLPPWDPSNPLVKLLFSEISARTPDGQAWSLAQSSAHDVRMQDLEQKIDHVFIGLRSAAGQPGIVQFDLTGFVEPLKHSLTHAKALLNKYQAQPAQPEYTLLASTTGHVPFTRLLPDLSSSSLGNITVSGSIGLGYGIALTFPERKAPSAPVPPVTAPPVRLTISNVSFTPALVTAANPHPDNSAGQAVLTNRCLPPIEFSKGLYDGSLAWFHSAYTQPDPSPHGDQVMYRLDDSAAINIKERFPPPQAQRSAVGHGFGNPNWHDIATTTQSVAIIVSALAAAAHRKGAPPSEVILDPQTIPFEIGLGLWGHVEVDALTGSGKVRPR